jgi:hypothetical protein
MADHGESSVHPLLSGSGYGPNTGITLRQQVAAMVFAGFAANPNSGAENPNRHQVLAEASVKLADALIAELARTETRTIG